MRSRREIPVVTANRMMVSLRRFQPILIASRDRSLDSSATSMLVTDILAEVFGYDKYTNVAREGIDPDRRWDLSIRTSASGAPAVVRIEAISSNLTDYPGGSRDRLVGTQDTWLLIETNAIQWRLYRLMSNENRLELDSQINLLDLDTEDRDTASILYPFTQKRLSDIAFRDHAITDPLLAALILSDSSLRLLRRELRRVSRGIKISVQDLSVAVAELLDKNLIAGEAFDQARQNVQQAASSKIHVHRRDELDELLDDGDESDES